MTRTRRTAASNRTRTRAHGPAVEHLEPRRLMTVIGGVDFPQGTASFADYVIDAQQGQPDAQNNPATALGAPQGHPGSNANMNPQTTYTLGRGGRLTVGFRDNALTNSGSAAADLYVFEIGTDYEGTVVQVRPTADTRPLLSGTPTADGFYPAGHLVNGGTGGLNIDAAFPGIAAGRLRFDAVRVTDDGTNVYNSGSRPGADIDAIGAIASAPAGGTIKGSVYSDADGDGTRDAGESARSGTGVWLDLDRDGTRDANEPRTTTGSDGAYAFAGVAAGTYRVRVEANGLRVSQPAGGGYYEASVAAGGTVTGRVFGLVPTTVPPTVPPPPPPPPPSGADFALDFDGVNDVATAADSASLNEIEANQRLTVEAVIRVDRYDQGWFGVVDKSAGNDWFGWTVQINQTTGIEFATATSGTAARAPWVPVPGQTYHVAVTYDRQTVAFYVNGYPVGSAPFTAPIPQTTGPLYVGRNPSGALEHADGTVDELRLWSKARSAAEVRGSFNAALTGREAGLVGYWRFNEGAGATARDLARGNTLRLGAGTEAPRWVAYTRPVLAGTLWSSDSAGRLFKLNARTGQTTVVGTMSAVMTDLAHDGSGRLFAVDAASNFYRVDPLNGATTRIGAVGAFVNALSSGPDGNLYAAGDDGFFRIDRATGRGTRVGSLGGFTSAGDIAFARKGTAYLTTASNQLVTVNLATGKATLVGPIGFDQIYGLAYYNGVLLGFSNASEQAITISTMNGRGTLVSNFGVSVSGANGSAVTP